MRRPEFLLCDVSRRRYRLDQLFSGTGLTKGALYKSRIVQRGDLTARTHTQTLTTHYFYFRSWNMQSGTTKERTPLAVFITKNGHQIGKHQQRIKKLQFFKKSIVKVLSCQPLVI
jgi:hypothetical protein